MLKLIRQRVQRGQDMHKAPHIGVAITCDIHQRPQWNIRTSGEIRETRVSWILIEVSERSQTEI